jgi:hypothetical protein
VNSKNLGLPVLLEDPIDEVRACFAEKNVLKVPIGLTHIYEKGLPFAVLGQ